MLILVCYFLGIHVSPVVNLDISIFFCWRLCCFLLVSSDFWFSARNCSLAPPGNRIIFSRHLMFFTFFIVSSECFDPHSALGNVFLFIMPDFQRESVMIQSVLFLSYGDFHVHFRLDRWCKNVHNLRAHKLIDCTMFNISVVCSCSKILILKLSNIIYRFIYLLYKSGE